MYHQQIQNLLYHQNTVVISCNDIRRFFIHADLFYTPCLAFDRYPVECFEHKIVVAVVDEYGTEICIISSQLGVVVVIISNELSSLR